MRGRWDEGAARPREHQRRNPETVSDVERWMELTIGTRWLYARDGIPREFRGRTHKRRYYYLIHQSVTVSERLKRTFEYVRKSEKEINKFKKEHGLSESSPVPFIVACPIHNQLSKSAGPIIQAPAHSKPLPPSPRPPGPQGPTTPPPSPSQRQY